MANQRKRLKLFYGREPQCYVAEFDHISHKTDSLGNQVPVALIKNIILVDPFGNFIKPSGFKGRDIERTNKPYMVADHTWVNFSKQWFKLPMELIQGDLVYFNAHVEKYPINRSDVMKKRDEIWDNAMAANDQLYQQWRAMCRSNPGVNFSASYKRMKDQQSQNLDDAREDQQNIELVDYSFSHIKDVRLIRLNPDTRDYKRIKYDYAKYEEMGYKYSFWLATRSLKMIKQLHKYDL